MSLSSEANFSVASLKEKFARAGRGKENATLPSGKKAMIEESEEKKPGKPEEEEEPLLVENKKRFVLFPIKYHEVHYSPVLRVFI